MRRAPHLTVHAFNPHHQTVIILEIRRAAYPTVHLFLLSPSHCAILQMRIAGLSHCAQTRARIGSPIPLCTHLTLTIPLWTLYKSEDLPISLCTLLTFTIPLWPFYK